ncbi:MAG: CHAD domain-containing protein [Acidimicrobiales bacterium]
MSQPPTSDEFDEALNAGEFLRTLLSTEVALLLRSDPIARRGRDPEGVHQLRVGSRRLRSELRILTRAMKPAPLRYFLRELHWASGVLGRQRDADVLGEVLDDISAQLESPLPPSVLKRLKVLQGKGNKDVDSLLNSSRYRQLIARLSDAVVHPPLHRSAAQKPAMELIGPKLDDTLRDLFDASDRFGEAPSILQLHQIRIHAKKGRYCAETASALLGEAARRLARDLESVQTVLGELHDYAVAITFLEEDIETPHATERTEEERAISVAVEHLVGLIEEMKLQWRDPLERARVLSTSLGPNTKL